MLSLLRIEWMKLKNYRTFWILSVLYLISIFGINYIVYAIQENIYSAQQAQGMAQAMLGNPPYSFPTAWQMTAYVSSYLLFMPGLLMIIMITNEYSYKTHRQNIIDGLTRSQFITVKIVLAVIASLLSSAAVAIAAFIYGSMQQESFSLEGFYHIGYFFIQCLSYCMVALLFAILFKRGGLAIGVFFLYAIVLENLLGGLLNRYANYSGRYLPLESTDNLIPLPFMESMQKQVIEPQNFTALLIAATLYLVLYVFFARKKFQADDL